jgi:hypothetical protein
MKRSRFNEEGVIGILREGESGSSVKAVCAKQSLMIILGVFIGCEIICH